MSGICSSLCARLRGWSLLAGLLACIAVLATGALVALFADVILILPAATRARAPWVLGGFGLVVLLVAAWRVLRIAPGRVARRCERRWPQLGSGLTNAVDLQGRQPCGPVQAHLHQEALERGRELARGARTWPLMRAALLVAMVALFAAGLAWGGTAVFGRSLLAAVAPRFLDPHGDHPPYSPLQFELTAADTAVSYGGSCEIRARVHGGAVDQLLLVAEDENGERSRSVMFRDPDRSHFHTLTNLRHPTRFHVTDGRGRSRWQRIAIRYTPRIEAIELATTFPAYTGLEPRTRQLGEEDLELPAGTTVQLRVASNRPLAHGTLCLIPLLGGETRTLDLARDSAAKRVVVGEFTLQQAVAFNIAVTDRDGLVSREPRKGRITVLPDERPRIRVIEPGRDAVATPEISIPVVVEAEDDYGVEQILWLRGLNESLERSFAMPFTPHRLGRIGRAETAFDLGDLGVRPGDTIRYFFEAVDNDPAGPNITTSRVFELDIISVEQYEAILRQARARKALFDAHLALQQHLRRLEETAEHLAERLAEPDAADDPELAGELAAFRRSLADYEKRLQELIGARPSFAVDPLFQDSLGQQRPGLERAREALGNGTPDPEAMATVARELGALRPQMDQEVGEPARQLAAVARLLGAADEFSALALRQREVVRTARRFAETSSEAVSRLQQMELQELAAAERDIADALDEWTRRVDDLIADLPDDPAYDELRVSANEFLGKVTAARIDPALRRAGSHFGGMAGSDGVELAALAEERMMALIERCQALGNQLGQGGCFEFQPRMQSAMQRSLQQIRQALGSGGSGGAGYGLAGNNVGLYGPDIQLSGSQGSGGDSSGGATVASQTPAASAAVGEDLTTPDAEQTVVPQTDAAFPLRYRNLVGEYFRTIGETAP
ncbi:MAG: hypothetical protein ACOCZK_00065 [Planctomycetota bacterium]